VRKKKKKHRFIGYWFLYFGALFLLFLPLAISGVMLNMLINYPGNQTAEVVTLLVRSIFSFFLLLYISGKSHFQWVVVGQEGLIARCLWKVLVQKKWTDIREIKIVRYPISVRGGFYSRWYLFGDGTPDDKWHNYILDEKRPIMIKYNKRSSKIIKQFWNDPINEETIAR